MNNTYPHQQDERIISLFEEEYRLILENANESIVVVQEGRIVFANPSVMVTLKESKDVIVNQEFKNFVHPDDRKMVVLQYKKRIKGEKALNNYSFRIINKNEEIRWIKLNAVLFTWKGKPAIYDFITDITEQKMAEEQLQNSEKFFRSVIENTSDIILISNVNGIVSYVSPAVERRLGYKPDDIINKNIFDFVHCREVSFTKEIFSKLKADKRKLPRSVEIHLRHKNNSWVIFEVMSKLLTEDFTRNRIVVNLRDISERRESDEKLRESEKRLRRLSSQLILTQERERKRIAREIHDSIGQSLTNIKLSIENTCEYLDSKVGLSAPPTLKKIVPTIQNTIAEVRKIVRNLRPSILDDLGIIATISWFIRNFKDVNPGIEVETRIAVKEKDILDELKIAIFRIIQESFNNISKHSNATHIMIEMTKTISTINMIIKDNGVGFNIKDKTSERSKSSFGIDSMRERARLSNGIFSINSKVGLGTTIKVSWSLK